MNPTFQSKSAYPFQRVAGQASGLVRFLAYAFAMCGDALLNDSRMGEYMKLGGSALPIGQFGVILTPLSPLADDRHPLGFARRGSLTPCRCSPHQMNDGTQPLRLLSAQSTMV